MLLLSGSGEPWNGDGLVCLGGCSMWILIWRFGRGWGRECDYDFICYNFCGKVGIWVLI